MDWLKCKVSPGLFSFEYAVDGIDCAGEPFSLFAPVQKVSVDRQPTEEESVDGLIRVEILERANGRVLVQLPAQIIGRNQWVTVNADQIEAEPVSQDA